MTGPNPPEEGLSRVAVVCPALNEQAAIGSLVAALRQLPLGEIIVVDNGSSDGTGNEAVRAGARVVVEQVRGYGAACLAGARAATADVLVYMDADGSFVPGEVPSVAAPVLSGDADLVLGSRTLSGSRAILPHQRLGNALAAWLFRALFGLRVTDLGPFRAIGRETLLGLGMTESTYGWPLEMMILAHTAGLRLREVPVQYLPRQGGKSKVSGTLKGSIAAGYGILKTTLRCAERVRAARRQRIGATRDG